MTISARHDRTVRLLAGRLESIAQAAERTAGGERDLERSVLRAAAATRNAVQLELLTAAEADAIWHAVAERHPGAPFLAGGPPLAA
jgi:hypothetical protein